MSASNLCGFQKSRAWIGGLRVEILVVFRHIFIRHLSPSQSFEAGVTGGAVVTSIPEGLIHRQVIQRCASNEVGPFDILRAQIRHKQFRECLFSSSTLCHVWPKHGWQERQSATLAAIVQRLDITTLFDLEHLQTTVISNSASVSSSTIGMIWLRPSSGSYVRSSVRRPCTSRVPLPRVPIAIVSPSDSNSVSLRSVCSDFLGSHACGKRGLGVAKMQSAWRPHSLAHIGRHHPCLPHPQRRQQRSPLLPSPSSAESPSSLPMKTLRLDMTATEDGAEAF
ncbi:hypothetical protein KC320_g157 [Hortaea werneckii]|nr:hypothetical protein KC320_g157 [Hortaea werneckii]